MPLASEVHEIKQRHNSEIWIFCDAVQEEFAIPVLEFVTVLTSKNFWVFSSIMKPFEREWIERADALSCLFVYVPSL